jgi:predicted RNase H-related nuclease YkuK (DUF458 family)
MSIENEYKFKLVDGDFIEDVGQYLRNYLTKFPNSSVYVGTDSDPKFSKCQIQFATVIALYDEDKNDGVHYIYSKQKVEDTLEEKDVFSRMWQEMERSIEVAEILEVELEGFLKRLTPKRLEELREVESRKPVHERNPLYKDVKPNQTKLVSIDVDINTCDGRGKNKSNIAYSAAKGFVVGMGYKVRFKPESFAAKSAADRICNKW